MTMLFANYKAFNTENSCISLWLREREGFFFFLNQSQKMKTIQEILAVSDYLNFRILILWKATYLKEIEKRSPQWREIFKINMPGKCLVARIMLPTDVATSHCGFWALESGSFQLKCAISVQHTLRRLSTKNVQYFLSNFYIRHMLK